MTEYSINVALFGIHICRVIVPSGRSRENARQLARNFAERFNDNGYSITLTATKSSSIEIDF